MASSAPSEVVMNALTRNILSQSPAQLANPSSPD